MCRYYDILLAVVICQQLFHGCLPRVVAASHGRRGCAGRCLGEACKGADLRMVYTPFLPDDLPIHLAILGEVLCHKPGSQYVHPSSRY